METKIIERTEEEQKLFSELTEAIKTRGKTDLTNKEVNVILDRLWKNKKEPNIYAIPTGKYYVIIESEKPKAEGKVVVLGFYKSENEMMLLKEFRAYCHKQGNKFFKIQQKKNLIWDIIMFSFCAIGFFFLGYWIKK